MRSIIVEGMDGAGKDTLIRDLLEAFPFHRPHERASTSLGGPVPNVGEWVARTAVRLSETGPWVFNRHPLVSEPIYGKYRLPPGRPMDETFTNPAWLDAYRRIVAACSVLVVCEPPERVVMEVLERQGEDAHMPGVYANRHDLYRDYALLEWPGPAIRYDYTRHTLGFLFNQLQSAVADK